MQQEGRLTEAGAAALAAEALRHVAGGQVIGLGTGLLMMAAAYPQLERMPHALMGGTFGGLHLAYGVYLYFTEKRKNAT